MQAGGSMEPLPPGTVLERRYRITSLLGQGGMSRVYLAEDTRLNVRVAIKENLQTSHEAQAQFLREAQILARLSHPNLPKVTDHFIDSTTGRQYLVMEYVEGEDLETMLKRTGPLPEATALAWMRQILDALEYLHRQQPPIIHRDVKPGNIKITPEGKAMLVDFGIAKVYDPRQATLTGARAVTPGYAPPEQYSLHTDQRSDIYSLGATLYKMLTGNAPPEAPMRTAGQEALVPPSRIVAGKVSLPVEGVILRALELETSKRWQSVGQLRAALERRGAPSPPPPQPPKAAIAVVTGVIAIVGVVLVGSLLLVSRTSHRPSGTSSMPTSAPAPTLPPTATLIIVPVRTPTPLPTLITTPTPKMPTATLTMDPRFEELNRQAEQLWDNDQRARAVEIWRTILAQRPDYVKALYHMGGYYYELDVDEAITYTKKALQYDPYCINAHYVLGAAYEKKGSKQEARAEYELVIKLDYAASPNNGTRDFIEQVRLWAQAALARLK